MLDGRTILVVGSTAGLGAAIYRLCLARGAEVIGVGRNRAAGEAMAAELGGRFHAADIGDADQVLALFDWLAKENLTIDGAVNNAAMTQPAAPIDEMELDLLDRLIAVNLRGTWLCVAREMAMMRAGGGAIVNIASFAG
jgi:NAD(P)-dependent dehydrogenase (short-subunit alcohol dehydrogenase family)